MDEQKKEISSPPDPAKEKQTLVSMLLLEAGMEFAVVIAAPLVGGILLGKWLDKKYGHSFFVIIGILLGLAITSVAVYQRIKAFKKILDRKTKNQ